MLKLSSSKPYLIRAIHEWCVDQGYTPYMTVIVDDNTKVPREYVKEGQIVLNLGPEATHQLAMGNDCITFSARFSGVAQALSIPIANIAAIFARENGQGMTFDVVPAEAAGGEPPGAPAADDQPPAPLAPGRSHLTRIK